jgi:microcystin degradation protein MlrC
MMMKRVLVGAMNHESNSFNPIIAGEEDFLVLRGAEVLARRKENDTLTGILDTLEQAGYEPVPTVYASAVPNGLVEKGFCEKLRRDILDMAKAAGDIDAVCFALHGSMTDAEYAEAEGPLLEGLRNLLPDIPIFVALDMHATMTEKMHRNADGFVGYKCAPHTDQTETGIHAAKMTIAALEQNVQAKSAWVKVPILIAGEQSSTTVQPMISLIEALREVEEKPGVLAASYLMGFPWCDNPHSSVGVYVTAETAAQAKEEALALAQKIWDTRNQFCFQTETYSQQEVLDKAFEAIENGEATPIYLSDSGDNPTAGSSSDCVGFLKCLLDDPRTATLATPALFGGIYDPEATLCCKGMVGQEVTVTFGAKFDRVTTAPITATGKVMAYYEQWDKFPGNKSDIALLRVHNVDIVLAEKHIGYTSPAVFADLGRDPHEAQIVVCKLGYLTAAQAAVAKRSIMALSKGSTNEDLASIPYEKTPRPIFPLDQDFPYDPKDHLMA